MGVYFNTRNAGNPHPAIALHRNAHAGIAVHRYASRELIYPGQIPGVIEDSE